MESKKSKGKVNKFLLTILALLYFTYAEALPVSSNVIVLKAENIVNFLVAGQTLIISGLPSDFVPVDISFYGTNITGTVGFPQRPLFSFGWTGPNYQDLIKMFVTPLFATGNFSSFSLGTTADLAYGKAKVIPAATNVFINVTSPDITAATNTQQIYITGYFLF